LGGAAGGAAVGAAAAGGGLAEAALPAPLPDAAWCDALFAAGAGAGCGAEAAVALSVDAVGLAVRGTTASGNCLRLTASSACPVTQAGVVSEPAE
jgi:hypothetical protein